MLLARRTSRIGVLKPRPLEKPVIRSARMLIGALTPATRTEGAACDSGAFRNAQIYTRQGVNLDGSTLADRVGKTQRLVKPPEQTVDGVSLLQRFPERPDRPGSGTLAANPRPRKRMNDNRSLIRCARPTANASPREMRTLNIST